MMALHKTITTFSAALLLSVSTVSASQQDTKESNSWFGWAKSSFWGASKKEEAQKTQMPLIKEKEEKQQSSWFYSTGSGVAQFVAVEACQYAGAHLGGQYVESKEKAILDAAYQSARWFDKIVITTTYGDRLQRAYDWGANVGGMVGHVLGGIGFDLACITYSTVSDMYQEYKEGKESEHSKLSPVALSVAGSIVSRISETGLTDFATKAVRKFAENTVKYGIRTYVSNPAITGTVGTVASTILGTNKISSALGYITSLPVLGYTNQKSIMDPVAEGIVDLGIRAGSYIGSKVVVGGAKMALNAFSNWYYGKTEQKATIQPLVDVVVEKRAANTVGSHHSNKDDRDPGGDKDGQLIAIDVSKLSKSITMEKQQLKQEIVMDAMRQQALAGVQLREEKSILDAEGGADSFQKRELSFHGMTAAVAA